MLITLQDFSRVESDLFAEARAKGINEHRLKAMEESIRMIYKEECLTAGSINDFYEGLTKFMIAMFDVVINENIDFSQLPQYIQERLRVYS